MFSNHVASMPVRLNKEELLDGSEFDFREYETTLRQLEIINHLTQGYAPTLAALKEIVRRVRGRKLRVLDIGFGGGDTLRAIAKWAHREKVDLELSGVDLNPWAREYARRRTPESWGIRFRTMNVFDVPGDEEYDVILNALFMHHLSDAQIVPLLKWMSERACVAWFINDLQRHPLAYHFIKQATRLAGFNRMIQNDAPLSVARSFTLDDWRSYLRQAGLDEKSVRIRRLWSFRYGLLWMADRGGGGCRGDHE